MLIIGELINSTRKRIRTAVENRDASYIKEVAVKQAEARASILDVNGGSSRRVTALQATAHDQFHT